MTEQRIAIIGAGPSGLAVLRAFESARRKGATIPEMVCYERQPDYGGLWNYTWRTGTDQYGEPVHGSMYRYLWSNGPKECLEFADYGFEEHFGRPIPSYPPRAVLHDYIKGRIEKSAITHYIKLNHSVKWVSYDEKAGKFTVTVKDLAADTVTSEEFDYVFVACGHFSVPNIPEFPGLAGFLGRTLHAHDFRSADEFAGKDVLCIGSSYSSEDIGIQCYKYGAKAVTFSHRTRPMGFKWPETLSEVPLLEKVEGRTCTFKDGTKKDMDAIILCTGYLNHFPFMEDTLRLKSRNRLYPPSIYKGIFWWGNPKCMYIGMQDQYYTFNMFDAQAWYARDVMLGRIKLPPYAEMAADIQKWIKLEEAVEDPFQAIDFQTEDTRDLLVATDYPRLDVDEVARMFKEWEHHKMENILTYRDHAFKSTLTGTLAPVHHTPWMKALDDSMEAFLNQPGTQAAAE
ncbi:NAD(P)/FAD-dependent oxidoreductase [Hyphomicrobium sp.]|uniref:NAD(P)-binding domain-containing protein n=1 Tax=Hyphomicrobium sp. TaxID=82 RepID=UPI0025BF729F|nr:NAD(P)/FAD-dependent oxidoreductase [Hyphomicrobium sp.]MCC7252672.1 NAD(P)/FAD-dependent oxidoreductase [Hyphomicrobium sp.]